jgi:hypothetical protein
VDALSDDDLAIVNGLLPWQCFTVDAWPTARQSRLARKAEPQPIPILIIRSWTVDGHLRGEACSRSGA